MKVLLSSLEVRYNFDLLGARGAGRGGEVVCCLPSLTEEIFLCSSLIYFLYHLGGCNFVLNFSLSAFYMYASLYN